MTDLGYEVFCHICGRPWHELSPEVVFVYGEGVWECFDEAACFGRRAAAERSSVWDSLYRAAALMDEAARP